MTERELAEATIRMSPAPVDMGWAITRNHEVLHLALTQAKGPYQRAVLEGRHSLSGSTLQGKARKYHTRYQVSIARLLERVKAVGVRVSEKRDEHGSRILLLY